MCFPHLSWPRASSLKLWLQLFFRKFPSFLRAAGLKNFGWNNTVCSKDMEIGSFPQKWMWRPYMVDLCSNLSTRLGVLYSSSVGHKHLPSVVLTLGSINPQKGQKWGVFQKNFTEVQKNRKFRNYHATAIEIFDTKMLKRRFFRPFSHVFTGGQTWRFLCDFQIAIWRSKWRQNVKPHGGLKL